MKMKIAFAIIGLAGLTLVSCKKDYECVCAATFGGSSVAATYEQHTKKDAEDKCDKAEQDLQQLSSSVTCSVRVKE
jgi:hypothetical protein